MNILILEDNITFLESSGQNFIIHAAKVMNMLNKPYYPLNTIFLSLTYSFHLLLNLLVVSLLPDISAAFQIIKIHPYFLLLAPLSIF